MKLNFVKVLAVCVLALSLAACKSNSNSTTGTQGTSSSTADTAIAQNNDSKESNSSAELKSFLVRFHDNPYVVMDETPVKYNSNGESIVKNIEEKEKEEIIKARDEFRKNLLKSKSNLLHNAATTANVETKAVFQNNDLVEDLVDNDQAVIRTLSEIDNKKLTSASLSAKPWSDDYWGIYKGILGARYADPKFAGSEWNEFHKYILDNPVSNYIKDGKIAMLSPSEKYDLLVNDKSGTLTKIMWGEGEEYFKANGTVETWMGICHGWAPASYMVPRPEQAVTVKSADNQHDIIFYPSDIKALSSLYWANLKYSSKFIGGRCNKKEASIRKDNSNGRIVEQDCFDTNPGTWHMAVVNQIAVSKRSFVIDATWDYQVWNQPVLSYSYKYFNPETFAESEQSKDVIIPINTFKKDKFKKFRSANAKYIVGVQMKLTYMVETSPDQSLTDEESKDATNSVSYQYDLELDQNKNIIGGEWYTNKHPDFLWTPEKDASTLTNLDRKATGTWNLSNENNKSLPAVWANVGILSSREGRPLGKILNALIEAARKK
ncbi:MAG: hypothetical protein HQK49_00265 [Oligoflexia bacterium]|nr:hypothetical protein [Oligoflexia bacterium]